MVEFQAIRLLDQKKKKLSNGPMVVRSGIIIVPINIQNSQIVSFFNHKQNKFY
jgi:hypothetical protein